MVINEEKKLKQYIEDNNIDCDHIRYKKSVHTVQDLMNVSGLGLSVITKTIIFKGENEKTIAAVVPALFRVSSKRVGKVLEVVSPEIASPEEAYEKTGYPAGGMPCFGYDSILIIDPKVFENEYIHTGGGSEFSTTKINTEELKKLNPIIQRIRGSKSN
jgi:Cys-tRNA(Pro)/Cys-tRNA(Cys) deacylase